LPWRHGEKTRKRREQAKAEAEASLRVSLPPGNDISARGRQGDVLHSNDQVDPAIRLTAVRLALPYEMPRLKAVDPDWRTGRIEVATMGQFVGAASAP
jgi:hypothetical protein